MLRGDKKREYKVHKVCPEIYFSLLFSSPLPPPPSLSLSLSLFSFLFSFSSSKRQHLPRIASDESGVDLIQLFVNWPFLSSTGRSFRIEIRFEICSAEPHVVTRIIWSDVPVHGPSIRGYAMFREINQTRSPRDQHRVIGTCEFFWNFDRLN